VAPKIRKKNIARKFLTTKNDVLYKFFVVFSAVGSIFSKKGPGFQKKEPRFEKIEALF
jgi:hypothetical protein